MVWTGRPWKPHGCVCPAAQEAAAAKLQGRALLSENNAIQMQTPQMVLQGAPDYPEESEASYGMGFFISQYRGHKRVEHGGNLDGLQRRIRFFAKRWHRRGGNHQS